MKKIIIAAVLVLTMVALGVFSFGSFAESADNVNTSDLPTELTVPTGKDYMFYAQTRVSRLDATKKDVRLLCVASQDFINAISNFVVTFTFTDGITPVTLKSVGLDTVFKSITACGENGEEIMLMKTDCNLVGCVNCSGQARVYRSVSFIPLSSWGGDSGTVRIFSFDVR